MINFKDYTLADVNGVMNIVTEIAFNGGEYSPINVDFFSKTYLLFIMTDAVDNYIHKDEDGVIIIDDMNGLFEFVNNNELDRLDINNDIDYEVVHNRITMYYNYINMINEKVEYIKQQNIHTKNTLTDVSMSELIDTINGVIEKFSDKPITTDDVKKLIESKDDIVKALTDKERLNERLDEYELKHKEREVSLKKIEETLNKRSDKIE